MLYRTIRPLLFRLDAERMHNLTVATLGAAEKVCVQLGWAPRPWSHPMLVQQLWDVTFANPVGLAAGFDKSARAPHVWPLLGFGFAELGTVTAVAQPGNPGPRLFRLSRDHALINRLGFNNAGADAVAARLRRLQQRVPPRIPIGINLGKSRETPLEQATSDYVHCLRQLSAFAAYVVINVSSPNTPGLRDLQTAAQLQPLLAALAEETRTLAAQRHGAPQPLLIKVAPDLDDAALAAIVAVARAEGAAGLVATNTTIRREGLTTPTAETGGLSGAPLRDRATAVVRQLYRQSGGDLPIIGVGGIFSARDAYAKIRAGASLVQLYTGMVFEGPRSARRIARGLVELLQADGFTHLREAVGKDA